MEPHLHDLDEYVSRIRDPITQSRYDQIKLTLDNQHPSSNSMIMDFPSVPYLMMDAFLTPEELTEFAKESVKTEGDWISITSLCLTVSTMDPSLDIFGVIGNPLFVSFNYLNELASENTVLWIKKSVEE
jgi:hypothetical protein